jgi:hypothetical protein
MQIPSSHPESNYGVRATVTPALDSLAASINLQEIDQARNRNRETSTNMIHIEKSDRSEIKRG